MPSKSRWALNPRKWFGTISSNGNHSLSRAPPTATTTRTLPCLSTTKPKSKRESTDINQINASITQLQLPAFSVRREKTSAVLPSSTGSYRQNSFFPTHTEPTIRKNGRVKEALSIDTTRCNIPSISTNIYTTLKHETHPKKHIDKDTSNMSNRCIVDYPIHTLNVLEESSFPTRLSSSSSMNDYNDDSSSSGIFTDERQQTESKETLSTLEVLSIESIADDSQGSLNHFHTRPIIHHYRRPMSVFQLNNDTYQQRQASFARSHRSHSADGILNDDQIISRQSSAGIHKTSRNTPSLNPLDKTGFVRITNGTYRLTDNELDYLSRSRKNSINSFVPYANYDDSLRSAKDEECYATLPRTSSTEQLNNHIQNDLRIIVNECIRPIVSSMGKTPSNKTHRYKRSQVNHKQINIDDITNKLLTSIDYSMYTRYQRCC